MSAYHTSISPNTRLLRPQDFAAAKGLKINGVAASSILPVLADKWQAAIPYTPRQLLDLLTHGYDMPVKAGVNFDMPAAGQVEITLNSRAFSSRLLYNTTESAALALMESSIDVKPAHRGGGTGKVFMRNLCELDMAFGSDKLLFEAGSNNGVYTWASMHAAIDLNPAYRAQIENASRIMRGRFDAVRAHLPGAGKVDIADLLELKYKDDLVRLVRDYKDVIVPAHLAPDMDDVSAHAFVPAMQAFLRDEGFTELERSVKTFESLRSIGRAFSDAAMQGKGGLSLPRMLLAQTTVPYMIDFDDAAQMKQVGQKLGGWRTIQAGSRPSSPMPPARPAELLFTS